MDDRKTTLYEHLARIGKALASPRRLALLDLLAQGPRTIESLAAQTGMSVANASQHLKVLRAARLVDADKAGTYVTCRVDDDVVALFLHLRATGERRLAEVDAVARAFCEDRDALEPVDAHALLGLALDGEVTVLDVRPVEEYRAGHLPNARSVPIDELRGRLADLPRDRAVVAYCRGPYCVYADEAVRVLREHGFTAHRLPGGPPEWRVAGVGLEASP